MFDRHKQKAAILFGVADVLLTVCAFEAAYQTRVALPLERVFFIIAPMKALLLGATLLFWVGIGSSIGVYRRFYGNDSRAAVYDTFLQVLFGTIGLVTFQFLLRLDFSLSRAFIGLFAAYSLGLLLTYRLLAGRVRGISGGSSGPRCSMSWLDREKERSRWAGAWNRLATTGRSYWRSSIPPARLIRASG